MSPNACESAAALENDPLGPRFGFDDSDLVMTERQGIEIDCCPKCRGVWLDRGEFDKVIERSTQAQAPRGDHRDHDRAPTHPCGSSHEEPR